MAKEKVVQKFGVLALESGSYTVGDTVFRPGAVTAFAPMEGLDQAQVKVFDTAKDAEAFVAGKKG